MTTGRGPSPGRPTPPVDEPTAFDACYAAIAGRTLRDRGRRQLADLLRTEDTPPSARPLTGARTVPATVSQGDPHG